LKHGASLINRAGQTATMIVVCPSHGHWPQPTCCQRSAASFQFSDQRSASVSTR
jgi:hypothetical protein